MARLNHQNPAVKDADPDPIRLSREQLYQEVWAIPTRLLAEKFGISDVGLAKACKRMRIPRPPRGYWRRKETGFPVRRSRLPKEREGDQREIVFFAAPEMQMPRRHKAARIAPEVFVSFREPHPLVDLAAKALRNAQAEPSGVLKLPSTSPVSLHVGRSNLGKALRLTDALFKAWLMNGHEVRFEGEKGDFAFFVSGPVELHFSIREEKDGRLCVELSGKRISRRRSYRRRLREKRRLSLEAWTGRIFAHMRHYLERRNQVILEQERQDRDLEQWKVDCELRARLQEAMVRKWQEERRRTDTLLKGEKEWRRSKEFREFIQACRDRMIEEGDAPDQVDRWVKWAESKTGGSSREPESWIEQTIHETREVKDEQGDELAA
jgi:hypothetical protein